MSGPRIAFLVAGILLAVAIFVVALVWGIRKFIKGSVAQVQTELEERYPGQLRRTAEANFFGLESQGVGQVRGMGVLALLEDRVIFLQTAPRREVEIPLEQMTRVDTTGSHLGKSRGRELLRITWTRPDGTQEVGAWLVADLAGWQADLQQP